MEQPPTQVTHPWRATIRTAFAYAVSTLVVVSLALPVVASEVGAYIPIEWQNWLLGASAFIGALASAVTKIMAMPKVNEWLALVGLGAKPSSSDGNE